MTTVCDTDRVSLQKVEDLVPVQGQASVVMESNAPEPVVGPISDTRPRRTLLATLKRGVAATRAHGSAVADAARVSTASFPAQIEQRDVAATQHFAWA